MQQMAGFARCWDGRERSRPFPMDRGGPCVRPSRGLNGSKFYINTHKGNTLPAQMANGGNPGR